MKNDVTTLLPTIIEPQPGANPQPTLTGQPTPTKLPEGIRNSRLYNGRHYVLRNDKTPVNAAGRKIGWNNPANRHTGPEVEKLAEETGYAIGIIIPAGYFFIDVDHALLPDGTWSEKAKEIVALFPDAYKEISQSRTGFHILAHTVYVPEHRQKNSKLGVEIYTKGNARHCALSFLDACGNIDAECAPGLIQCLHAADLLNEPRASAPTDDLGDEWRDDLSSDDDDARLEKFFAAESKAEVNELVARQFDANHVPKTIPTNSQLFNGEDILSEWRPSNGSEGDGADHSSLDFALASRLARHCDYDHGTIERLMIRSELARDKWRDRPKYLRDTIHKAVADHTRTVDKPATPEEITQYAAEGEGFIYISELDKTRGPDGRLYGQVQFDNEFSNRKFYGKHLGRKAKHSAWDNFVRDPDFGRTEVCGLRFRPDLPPLSIFVDPGDGQRYFNDFEPAPVRSVIGDVSPFLNHIMLLFPNRSDAEIMLSFMAHTVQFPGIKPTWGIVIIGPQGNGKTLLFEVTAEAIGRGYASKPRSGGLDNKFNAYVERSLILGIEEIRLRWKPELLDTLKPLISDSWVEVEGKGRDQITARNFAHIMLFSNHDDAVNKTRGDRRFCVLLTKQRTTDDITRDMGGDYFKALWHWLESERGYAICAHYLRNYKIPDSLDFKGRAPITSTTAAAIEAALTDSATTLRDAVESVPGFCGGFIETSAAKFRLRNEGLWGGPRKLAETLDALEYHRHPRLSSGDGQIRCNSERLRLYVKRGCAAEQLNTHDEIKAAFKRANPTYTTTGFLKVVP